MADIGSIWAAELDGYPEWALDRACAWWVSKDNPNRRWAPIAGDISERAHKAMSVVRFAEMKVVQRSVPEPQPMRRPEEMSDEELMTSAAKILKEAGFKLNPWGGVQEGVKD